MIRWLPGALLLLACRLAAADAVVTEVFPGYAAEAAGLRPGDTLTGWRPAEAGAGGEFASPFDVEWVAVDPGQRGPLVIVGVRAGEAREWTTQPGHWALRTRPAFSAEQIARYDQALAALSDNQEQAVAGLDDLSRELRDGGDLLAASWVQMRIASELRALGLAEQADRRSRAAAAAARAAGYVGAAALMLETAGREHGRRNRMEPAVTLLNEGLELRRASGRMPLQAAVDLNNLGIGYSGLSRFDEARRSAEGAVALYRREIPGSLFLADALHTLGNLEFWSGDLDAAETAYIEMLGIRRERAPESVYVARSASVLGNIYWRRGDLDRAQDLYDESARLYEATGAEPGYLAQAIMSQGFVAHDRGDLAAADQHYLRALDLLREHDPGGDAEASALMALGNTARVRHDLPTAEAYYTRAQAVYEAAAPEGQRAAIVLHNRALLARTSGDLDLAQSLAERSLEILRRINPDSVLVPNRISSLAEIALGRGDVDQARQLAGQSLGSYRAVREESLQVAGSLELLGRIEYRSRNDDDARAYFDEALALAERFAPQSLLAARGAHGLALVQWRRGDRPAAAAAFVKAVAALRAQGGRIGGDAEGQAGFAAAHGDIYRDYVAFLLDGDEAEAALAALGAHRRAQVEAMLAQRGVRRKRAGSAADHDRLAQLDYQYEQVYEDLLDDPAEQEEFDALVTRLSEIRLERKRLLGSLAPAKADPAGSRSGPLPDDANLLAWVIRPAASYALLRRHGQVRYRKLELDSTTLAGRIERLRTLIQVPGSGQRTRAALDGLARDLYRDLVAPLEARLEGANVLTLSPDGPLWRVPFAALISSPPDAPRRYWIENSALRIAPVLTASGSGRAFQRVVAFADPTPASGAEPPTAWTLRRRLPGPLPFAGREARSIGALFDSAEVYLGDDASEAHLKRLADPDVLHLATHGFLDPYRAMDAYLLLAPDAGGENGLLHAWEVFEQLELDTGLVTLSACETAAGAGQGLLGLSWAFHGAGARNVFASLWPVEDESTSELMTRFYRRVRAGEALDLALARAQSAMISRDRFAHPFYWAGFQLSGL